MVEKHIKKVRYVLERLEIIIEDLVIAVLAFIVLLIILGSGSIVYHLSDVLKGLGIKVHSGYIALAVLGWIILPWILMLGMMVIARDFWIMRRILEKAVKIEAKLEKEIKVEQKR